MCKLPLPSCVLAVGAVAVALALYFVVSPSWSAQPQPASPPEDPAWKDFLYTGADTCKQCHTTPMGRKTDFCELNEYTTWKTVDKHSIAYAVLEGSLGRRMGQRLGNDEKFVLKPEAGCLGCHSMNFPGRYVEPFNPRDGVSCDGCHGPSSQWFGPHSNPALWRNKLSPEQKHAQGMRDLRNPLERAKLCSSCHIGNAEEGRVVTHTMYAAGHPLLSSFEVATFSRSMPQHWYDLKDVPLLKSNPEKLKDWYDVEGAALQNSKLALVGGVASLRQQMALIAGRANGSGQWPELKLPALAGEKNPKGLWDQAALAHTDCAACHHDLRIPSWRAERGYGLTLPDGEFLRSKPGRPQPRLWSLPLATLAMQPDEAKTLSAKLKSLHLACDARPFGDIDAVGKAAAAARDTANPKPIAAQKLSKAEATVLLKRLSAMATTMTPDFDTARQLAGAFIVIYKELGFKPADESQVHEVMAALERELDLNPTASLENRRKLVAERVKKALGHDFETLEKALAEVDTDKLREALLNKEHIDAMQQLRDKELAATMKKMSRYDPAVFKKHMAELNKLLGDSAAK